MDRKVRHYPTSDELRKFREESGMGLVECRRALTLARVSRGLLEIEDSSASTNERVLRDALLTLVELAERR